MKTLIVIRHAKSDWHLDLPDFERPLNTRGFKDAPEMAERLASRVTRIDAVLHSAAKRTTQTANYFVAALGVAKVFSESSIYEASLDDLCFSVSMLDTSLEQVVMVGHNPGVSALVYHYTGQNVDMVTTAMACVQFEVDDWSAIIPKSGKLVWFDFPKNS